MSISFPQEDSKDEQPDKFKAIDHKSDTREKKDAEPESIGTCTGIFQNSVDKLKEVSASFLLKKAEAKADKNARDLLEEEEKERQHEENRKAKKREKQKEKKKEKDKYLFYCLWGRSTDSYNLSPEPEFQDSQLQERGDLDKDDDEDSVVLPPPTETTTSTQGGQKDEDDWTLVSFLQTSKKTRKVQVPARAMGRVIGRGGCNTNAIRDVSGAKIYVEKNNKSSKDRFITIKGSADAKRQAHAMITALVTDPDKELVEIHHKIKTKPPPPAENKSPVSIPQNYVMPPPGSAPNTSQPKCNNKYPGGRVLPPVPNSPYFLGSGFPAITNGGPTQSSSNNSPRAPSSQIPDQGPGGPPGQQNGLGGMPNIQNVFILNMENLRYEFQPHNQTLGSPDSQQCPGLGFPQQLVPLTGQGRSSSALSIGDAVIQHEPIYTLHTNSPLPPPSTPPMPYMMRPVMDDHRQLFPIGGERTHRTAPGPAGSSPGQDFGVPFWNISHMDFNPPYTSNLTGVLSMVTTTATLQALVMSTTVHSGSIMSYNLPASPTGINLTDDHNPSHSPGMNDLNEQSFPHYNQSAVFSSRLLFNGVGDPMYTYPMVFGGTGMAGVGDSIQSIWSIPAEPPNPEDLQDTGFQIPGQYPMASLHLPTYHEDEELGRRREMIHMRLCTLCTEQELNILFLNCMHCITCERCAESILFCPRCGQPVVDKLKVFLA